MSSSKQYNLQPSVVINELSLGASKTSLITEALNKDNITYQIVWTGTLAGAFTVETSLDYMPGVFAGTWSVVPIGTALAAGAPNDGIIELNQFGEKYVRLVFTRSGGTGDLKATIAGKAI